MNVYPDNKIEIVQSLSAAPDGINDIKNILHPYLSLRAEFNAPNVTITGAWGFSYPVYVDALILGNTNAGYFRIILKNVSGVTVYDSGTVSKSAHTIHIHDLPRGFTIGTFALTLSGGENLKIGLVYLGEKIDIGLFAIGPQHGMELQGESSRSMGGQSYGLRQPTLDTFSVSFPRVENRLKKIISEYIKTTLNVQPHVIDPYPLAREEFPPMYATLTGGYESTKRNEPGFWWDFEAAWKEAK